VGLLKLVIGNI